MRRTLSVSLLALGLTIAASAQGGWEEGLSAFERKDWTSAQFELEPLARSGHAAAAVRLGLMYQNGWGRAKDLAQAFQWMSMAAEKGDAAGQTNLGIYYLTGLGTPRNEELAAKWLSKAADQAQPNAQHILGTLYYRGNGVAKDEARAVQLFQLAASKNVAAAWESLGMALWDGRGVEMNRSEAVSWFRRAAERGMAVSQNRLAAALFTGDGTAKDLGQAMQWFERAAQQGDAASLHVAGQAYLQGIGVPRDHAKAALYLILSVKRAKPADLAKFTETRDKAKPGIAADEWGKAEYRARDWMPVAALPVTDQPPASPPAAPSPPPSPAPPVAASQPDPGLTRPHAPPTSPQAPDRPQRSSGSGIVVSADGMVLTNSHVVTSCRNIRVIVEGYGPQAAVVQSRDEVNDLALLKASLRPADIARFREDKPMRSGDSIVVVGYPLSTVLSKEPNVTAGVVSAMAGIGGDKRHYQITAPVQKGNSGGPLTDMNGNVVGVIVSKLGTLKSGDIPQNVNFAIKSDLARSFLIQNGIQPLTAPSPKNLSAADVGDQVRKVTALIECEG